MTLAVRMVMVVIDLVLHLVDSVTATRQPAIVTMDVMIQTPK